MNKPHNYKVIKRIIAASIYSIKGIKETFKTEVAFREECYLGIILIPLSFYIADNAIEWILLISSFLLIILTEIINSSIEAAIDRFGGEIHDLSAKAKDAGSAAVAIAIIICIITWGTIILF